MLKNKGIILLALTLLLTLGIGNIVLAVEIHEEPGQDLNNTWSNKASTISDVDNDKEEVSDLEEAKFSLRLTVGKKEAKVGEEEVTLDVAPFIENGRTMVPLRFIGEQLGADISWDQTERKIGYKLGDKEVVLWIDKNIALVNGIEMPIDEENPLIVPVVINNRTFVPVRFIVEALGFEIEWNGETNEVMVQDYNSSRSNKPSPIAADSIGKDDINDSEDKEPGKAEAQDYNSSRSNKPSPIAADSIGKDDDDSEDKEPGKAEAQDYNSSRSNKPSPIAADSIGKDDVDDSEDKEPGKAEAQDYNSSRSNKPSPIAERTDDDEDQPTGVIVTWDSTEKRAIYKLKGIIIEFWVEKDLVLVNGIQTKINEKDPTIILNKENDPQLGPIHFISRVSGYILEWNPATRELTIRKG